MISSRVDAHAFLGQVAADDVNFLVAQTGESFPKRGAQAIEGGGAQNVLRNAMAGGRAIGSGADQQVNAAEGVDAAEEFFDKDFGEKARRTGHQNVLSGEAVAYAT